MRYSLFRFFYGIDSIWIRTQSILNPEAATNDSPVFFATLCFCLKKTMQITATEFFLERFGEN